MLHACGNIALFCMYLFFLDLVNPTVSKLIQVMFYYTIQWLSQYLYFHSFDYLCIGLADAYDNIVLVLFTDNSRLLALEIISCK